MLPTVLVALYANMAISHSAVIVGVILMVILIRYSMSMRVVPERYGYQ